MHTKLQVLFLAMCSAAAGVRPYDLGRFGGKLVVSQRAEPKTFNPVVAIDAPSRDVIRRMMGDLISINRATQATEPNLARSWTVSKDGLHYTLQLREALKFSDGEPCDADDIVFTFRVYQDEKMASPQRDLLMVGGKPLSVVKLDQHRVRFDFAAPYAAAERLFDSIAILPRHLLEHAYTDGSFQQVWTTSAAPQTIAGMGPFRLKEYRPGERVILERNPYYWKLDAAGKRLPYLDEIHFLFVAAEEAQVLRFVAGESAILNRFGARSLPLVEKESVTDAGPSLEYNFLFFNLGEGAKPWFADASFRKAVSAAIDRDGIVKLIYSGRAAPLWTHVPPGNRLWVNTALPKPARSIARAKQLLSGAGFRWNDSGALIDAQGGKVVFSILVSASSPDRVQIATILQDDLRQLGMEVQVAQLEFRSVLDRVTRTRQFDACVLGLGGGDSDPNSEVNVWLSSGATHLWNPSQKKPSTPWEAEIDLLIRAQLVEPDYAKRKRLFDRVQEIEAEQMPIVSLVSPHVLVAAKSTVGNFRPGVLDHYTLWNVEYLYLTDGVNR